MCVIDEERSGAEPDRRAARPAGSVGDRFEPSAAGGSSATDRSSTADQSFNADRPSAVNKPSTAGEPSRARHDRAIDRRTPR